jgi:putative ABC transport system ATP-binding protein
MDTIALEELTKTFLNPDGTRRTVLSDVSCDIEPGETVAIVGPSGSGKSTLLNLIGALDVPTSGTVRVGDINVATLWGTQLSEYRATRTGFVFQDHHLLPQLSALENVLLPTLAVKNRRDAPERASALLEAVGLTSRKHAFPGQMSGGERQRVAIARALINGAQLLLCDEPTGNLDRNTGAVIIDLLLDLAHSRGATVLMVTHNTAHAARFSRCLELRDGNLTPVAAGTTGGE